MNIFEISESTVKTIDEWKLLDLQLDAIQSASNLEFSHQFYNLLSFKLTDRI